MEKSSGRRSGIFSIRLLIFISVLISAIFRGSFFVFAEQISSRIENIFIQPDSEFFFTETECGFTLLIPGAEPAKIRATISELPSGVRFLSSKREEFFDSNGSRGTRIKLVFSFSQAGNINLLPLNVQIDTQNYKIPFLPILVYENPMLLAPIIEIDFDSDLKSEIEARENPKFSETKFYSCVGIPVKFFVSLKYFAQIEHFSWDLPKNSIFKEVERYDFEKTKNSDFSNESFSIARFEWIPLAAGEYDFPKINISAIAYDGEIKSAVLPKYKFFVFDSGEEIQNQKNESDDAIQTNFKSANFSEKIFAPFFEETSDSRDSKSTDFSRISFEDCEKIAKLRSIEKKSFPHSKAAKNRADFEYSLGIENQIFEPSKPLFFIFVVIAVIFFLFGMFFLLKRKIKFVTFFFCATAFFVFVVFAQIKNLSEKHGIFAGRIFRSVPEEKNSSLHFVNSGIRVKVTERAGNWIYVKTENESGWISADEIFEIK